MRASYLVILLPTLVLAPPPASGAERADRLELRSRVERVVVYSRGAAVTRRAECDVASGRSRLVMAGLPPALRAGTLRARLVTLDTPETPDTPEAAAVSHGRPRILSVDYRLEPRVRPGRADEERILERVNALDLELKAVDDERALLNGRAELVNGIALSAVPPEAKADGRPGAPKLDVESWGAVLDFSERETASTLARLRELNESARGLNEKLASARAELKKIRTQTVPAVATAAVDVECPAACRLGVLLTYSVSNAAWYPAYTFRVDTSVGIATMTRSASCAQNTGEGWEDVEILFSSGEEERAASIPELRTWLIVERASGGGIEPAAAGEREPGEVVIVSPLDMPPARAALVGSPLAALGFMDAGRLGDAFGYGGLGSLGQAVGDLRGRRDILLGGTGVVGILGVGGGGAGRFGFRSGGGRKRAALRGGGSAASESACTRAEEWLPKHQEADGSWSSRRHGGRAGMDEADTALALLSFLGAGYTEKTGPNKEKKSVRKAVGYLTSRLRPGGAIGRDLWTQALVATALSEAYGMARVGATGEAAKRAVRGLERQVLSAPWPLQPGLANDSWPDGPSNLALVAMALKSATVAGLQVSAPVLVQVTAMLDDLERSPPSPLNAAAAAAARIWMGWRRSDTEVVRHARTLLGRLPRWERGRMDFRYFYLGTLVMFQMGGEYWKVWNAAIRDMLIKHQVRGGENDGTWPPADIVGTGAGISGRGASRVYSTAMVSMCLEIYYRYLPLYGAKGAGGAGLGDGVRAEKRHVPPILSARGRDFRSKALKRESIPSDGRFRRVAVERRDLTPRLYDLAAPVEYRHAFMQAEVVNDRAEPLLAGEAHVYAGTAFLGATFLETVPPGEKLTIPLGLDWGVELARRTRSERREAGFRGRTRRTFYEVTLEAANRKRRPVELVVVDRVPRTADERISVKDVFLWGGEVVHDPEDPTGEVRFTLTLPPSRGGEPGETRKAGLQYTVEHPANVEAVRR